MLCSLSSCNFMQRFFPKHTPSPAAEQTKKELPPMYLGTVHQVYPAQKFALLRIIGPSPRPGVTLISHPADGANNRIGNLVVSENTAGRRGIIAADIRSGQILAGDFIYLYRNISSVPDDEEERRIDLTPSPDPEPTPAPTPVAQQPRVSTPTPSPTRQPAATTPTEPATDDFTALFSGEDEPAPDFGGSAVSTPSQTPQPQIPGTPERAPSYLDSIPDDINQWN